MCFFFCSILILSIKTVRCSIHSFVAYPTVISWDLRSSETSRGVDWYLTTFWNNLSVHSSRTGSPRKIWVNYQSVYPVAQSVQRLTTAWTVRGSNPDGGEIFRTHPHRPWGPPSLLYNGHRVFPKGKTAGAWCWPSIPPSTEVENEGSYTSIPPLGLRGLL
jgi:hypothetical protein